jgi:lysophospholipase L1-like esterase
MKKLLYCLIFIVALALMVRAQQTAVPAKTQISGVVYRADGTPATGTLVISWPDFVTADKQQVLAGALSTEIASDGTISVQLVPTAGATPAIRYKVLQYSDDGTPHESYWSVPATVTATVAAISSAAPASAAVYNGLLTATTNYVHTTGSESIAGDKTFSDPVVLSAGVVAPASSNFVFEGDSITAGLGLAAGQDWPSQAMLGTWFAGRGVKTNNAVSGNKTADIIARYPASDHPLSPAVTGNPGYFFVLAGINDIVNTTDSAATILARLQSIWSTAAADGYKVVAATITPMQGLTAAQEATRQAINLSIRTSSSWNYLLDFDPLLPDPSDTNLYQDGLHPTAAGAVLLGRTAANLMPSGMASSLNTAPAYDQTVQGWTTVGKWLNVGATGTTDALRVYPQTAGSGAQVVATDGGNTVYRPLTMVGSKIQYSNNGGNGDLLTYYPGGPGLGGNLSSTTYNQSTYTPLTLNASELRFSKGLDTLHFYPGVTGSGTGISSARADLSAYSPLAITASNWSVDNAGDIATQGSAVVGNNYVSPNIFHVATFGAKGTAADDCPAIQNALNAAATFGANSCGSGVVVLDPIRYACNTALTVDPEVTSVRGNGATINAANATISGPLVTFTNSHTACTPPTGSNQMYLSARNYFEGLGFIGPCASGATLSSCVLDSFKFDTPGSSYPTYSTRFEMRNVSTMYFRNAEVYGNTAYLLVFNNVTHHFCNYGLYHPAGTVNTGENISHYGGVIAGCNWAVYTQDSGTFNFFGTSFDYNTQWFYLTSAQMNCYGCHTESTLASMTTQPMQLWGTNALLNYVGGDMLGDGSQATVGNFALAGNPGVQFNFDGTQFYGMAIGSNTFGAGSGFGASPAFTFRNSKFGTYGVGSNGLTDFTAIQSWAFSTDAAVRTTNLLYDGSFEQSSVSDPVWIGADTATITSRLTGANISAAVSTDTHYYGSQSLKVTKAGAAGTAAGLYIAAPFPAGQTLGSQSYWAKPGAQTGSFTVSLVWMQVLGFDANNVPIVGRTAVIPQNGATTQTLTSAAQTWTGTGQGITPRAGTVAPAWANYVGLYFDFSAMNAGSIYVDGVIFNAF